MVPTFLLAAVLVFSLLHLMPGDPAAVMLGDTATPEQVQALRVTMGFDKPFYVQFYRWFTGALQGDFGQSIFFHKPVLRVIRDRAEVSLFIAVLSMALTSSPASPSGDLGRLVQQLHRSDQLGGLDAGHVHAHLLPGPQPHAHLFRSCWAGCPARAFPSVVGAGTSGTFGISYFPASRWPRPTPPSSSA